MVRSTKFSQARQRRQLHKRGTSQDILDPQRSIGTAEDVENFLRLVTEFIENVDNDVDVTGGPKRV